MHLSPLYVVLDEEVCARAGWRLVDCAEACLAAGARLLQVRAKSVSARRLFEECEQVVQVAKRSGAIVIVNDRADVARLVSAAGVHVGQEDLPPADVRAIVGPDSIVGFSTHTIDQIDGALTEPIDYLAIGPVFGTPTKDTGYDAVGLTRVREAADRAAAAGLGIVAIGGITLDRARSVIDAGAHSVAVISDLLATGDPAARVREYLSVLRPQRSG